ncbi:MAG: 1-acyl-sn-glycerol-3-phosphate acyltransferase [Candidatus Hydrogenedentota bacterium]
MQSIVCDRPYQFVPPRHGRWWPIILQNILPAYLKRSYGIETVEIRGGEKLRASLGSGHGILLAPNHSRPCDPMLMLLLARETGRPFFTMASAHLFMNGGLQAWLLPRAGAFSVYREGMDRAAVSTAVDILAAAERPLVLFPEGIVTRTNDRLGYLQEGTAFIARSAAKKRSKAAGTAAASAASSSNSRVVVHPVAIRYYFRGDIEAAVDDVLTEIEKRFSWRPQKELAPVDRIIKVGEALLGLKEKEYLGAVESGTIADRLARLIDRILSPMEREWLGGKGFSDTSVVSRVKRLRAEIVPDLVGQELTEEDRAKRWRHLADIYLVQQLSLYPPDYVASQPTPERILETIERFEEDLTDNARIHRPMEAVIEVGDAIEVSEERATKGEPDPLMKKLEDELARMLSARTREQSSSTA